MAGMGRPAPRPMRADALRAPLKRLPTLRPQPLTSPCLAPDAMRTLEDQQTQSLKPPSRWSGTYTRLRDAIFAHRLAPGIKLPEDELASIYAVSRTVIRSALQALAHDRLVRLEPNRGAFVAQPSQTEAREFLERRMLAEPRAAALAAARATPADIARLRAHLDQEHE